MPRPRSSTPKESLSLGKYIHSPERTKFLKETPRMESRLTFSFPLSEERERALKILQRMEMDKEKKISESETIQLLESKDLVIQDVGLCLLRQFEQSYFEKNQKTILSLLNTLIDRKVSKIYLAEVLGRCNQEALEVLDKINNEDLPENERLQAAWNIKIKNISDQELARTVGSLKNEGFYLRQAFINALPYLKERALPILKDLVDDDSFSLYGHNIIMALGKTKLNAAYDFLQKICHDAHSDINKTGFAVEALGYFGDKALPLLEEMADHEDDRIRKYVLLATRKVGKKGLALLKRKAQSDKNWNVRHKAIQFIAGFGKDALPILKELELENMDDDELEISYYIRAIEEGHKELLSSQKPVFATPYPKEAMKRIDEAHKIAKELKIEFPDRFVGLFGCNSVYKGYVDKKSDNDLDALVKDYEVYNRLKELLGHSHSMPVVIESDGKIRENQASLFYGTFIGDFSVLQKLQLEALEDMNEKEWDSAVRDIVYAQEVYYLQKAKLRLGLSDEELERIQHAASLRRVPPPYKVALDIIRKRIRRRT